MGKLLFILSGYYEFWLRSRKSCVSYFSANNQNKMKILALTLMSLKLETPQLC